MCVSFDVEQHGQQHQAVDIGKLCHVSSFVMGDLKFSMKMVKEVIVA